MTSRPLSSLPRDAGAPARVRWLLAHLTPYARDLAVWAEFGAWALPEAVEEIGRAGGGAAAREGWGHAEGAIAAAEAWENGVLAAARFRRSLAAALRPLLAERAPGVVLLRAAIAAEDAAGVWLPDDARLRAVRLMAGRRG